VPDIDALILLVDKATKAYKQCKAWIEALKKAFAEKCRSIPDKELSIG
jgi:hypothetical protein